MKKPEPTAVKTDGGAKTGAVVVLKTMLEPEKKPEADKAEKSAPKPKAKAEPDKAEKPAVKPKADKVEKSAPKSEAKAEPNKAEKAAPKIEAKSEADKAEKSEAKAEPAKTEKSAPKPKAKTEPDKAEKSAVKSEADKVEKAAPKAEAKTGPVKAGKPVARLAKPEDPDPKPEEPKVQDTPVTGPPSVESKAQVVDSPLKMMKLEFDKRTNVIKQEMRNIQDSFLVIGFQLHWIKTNNMYRVLNYKNIMDYAEKEFGIKKTTCCNFINIIDTYAERDEHGEIIESIAECYRNFSSSQLIAMLGMPEEIQQQVTPDMTVREINRLRRGEPEKPPVDVPKVVISEAKPAAPVATPEAPKPAAPVAAQTAPKPAASVTALEAPKPAAPVTALEAPKPVTSVTVHEAAKPAIPAANNSNQTLEKHAPKTLLEIESYSGYRSMMDKIDGMLKDVFKAGTRMKVKLVCEEG